ncbi:hypothetical protein NG799_26420 [Laspinema sp. D1]|uniref:Uncharacterized protein n=1 Tax=Laspinema palackyanum D2a TaxID=2953684 RepID=A0ABT2N0U9_9CYAN|nr:hypothetical protein [Laspinema sp. D2a]
MKRESVYGARTPSEGRSRSLLGTFSFEGSEPLNKTVTVRVSESMATTLKRLDNKQEWLRQAISEKLARESN